MKNFQRHIPENYIQFEPKYIIGSYPKDIFACYVNKDKPAAIFFIGKRSKPAWHFSFKDNEAMKKKCLESIGRIMSWEDMKEKRKEEKRREIDLIDVGQIYSYSWGYGQTNVNFYQVTKKAGKTFFIKEISFKSSGEAPSGSMSGYKTAAKDMFIQGPEIKKMNLSMPYGCLMLTDDKTKHFYSWWN